MGEARVYTSMTTLYTSVERDTCGHSQVTSAPTWTHQHTRLDKHRYPSAWVWAHLSSDAPSAGSVPPGLQAGGWTGLGPERRRVLNHLIPALCLSLPHPKLLISALPPCFPSPTWGWGPLTVQGGWQGRDFVPPLPVGECCRVLQGAACWERTRAFISPWYVSGPPSQTLETWSYQRHCGTPPSSPLCSPG